MWACEHLLDQGDDQADRMGSVYLTSTDGLSWDRNGSALDPTAGTPGTAVARGSPARWESRRQMDREL